jgi:hypothetical protein
MNDTISFKERVEAFITLGKYFDFGFVFMEDMIQHQIAQNHWFTADFIHTAIDAITTMLQEEPLMRFYEKYAPFFEIKSPNEVVAVISAGNIPMAGFHDFFAVLVSGCSYQGKLSKEDNLLLRSVAKVLITIEPRFKNKILFTTQPKDFDRIITTGSNNSARYFEYYFGKYPHILRKNRNSVAVLSGKETTLQLELLFEDIFLYFGMGCRSVSLLFVPKNYNFDLFITICESKKAAIEQHAHYCNNLDYQKTIHLMNKIPYQDAGIALLTENKGLQSPVGIIHYVYYEKISEVQSYLDAHRDAIQCIVSTVEQIDASIDFGSAQYPKIDEFADGIDVVKWLLNVD